MIGLISKYQRFIRFCVVGGTGALITFGATWVLTELVGMWYMASMVIAVAVATVWNYNFNALWTFRVAKKVSDASYEWDSFYKGNIIQRRWKRSIARTVWEWIPNSSKLLDVGCGSSPIITHYPGAIGIDTNKEKLEFMRTKASAVFEDRNLSEYKDNEFDYVLCVEVIEHVPNPALLVKEIARVVKAGGKVVIATPDYSKKLWHLAEAFTPYKEDHHNNFTMDKLDRLCEKFDLMPTIYKYVAGCDLVEMFVKCPQSRG